MFITNWNDNVIPALMIGLPLVIGTYYGSYKTKNNSISEYLYGAKSINVIPLSFSFIASHVSGTILLEITDEAYLHGAQYFSVIFSYINVTAFILLFYLPVFNRLQLNSPYEYLKRRFNHKVRICVLLISFPLFIVNLALNLYIPAAIISKVSGVSVNFIVISSCATCLLYTAQGGLKAVVWTQLYQISFTVPSLVFITVLSYLWTGSLEDIITTNKESNRLQMFKMEMNPFTGLSFWTFVYGLTFKWLALLAIQPITIQRLKASTTHNGTKMMMVTFPLGMAVITFLSCSMGLLIYTKYHICHPMIVQKISKGEIFSHFILELTKIYPSVKYLFITVMVNTVFSTTSAMLNSTTSTVYEEIVLKYYPNMVSNKESNLAMKVIVILLGILSSALVYLICNSHNALQIAYHSINLVLGAVLFVFSFGMMFPWGNSKGAMAGIIASLLTSAWILTSVQSTKTTETLSFPTSNLKKHGCQITKFNSTSDYRRTENITSQTMDESITEFNQLSIMYYTLITAMVGLMVGIIISFITGTENLTKLDSNLIVPQLQKEVKERQKYANNAAGYELVTM